MKLRPRDIVVIDGIAEKIGVDRSNAIRVSVHYYYEFLGLKENANTPA